MDSPKYAFDLKVAFGVVAPNKLTLLRAMAAQAEARLGQSENDVFAALKRREELGSTALGNGVALPHAQLPGPFVPLVLFARLARPIDFDARDSLPVDLVFVVLWPAEDGGLLTAMSGICRALRDPGLLRRLRTAQTPGDVVDLVRDHTAPSGPDLQNRK